MKTVTESASVSAQGDIVSVGELGSWRMWRQLCRLRLAAEASTACALTDVENEAEWINFCQRYSVDPATSLPVPPEFSGCQASGLKEAVVRDFRIARWKQQTFGPHAKEHFESRKPALDRVVYSLLRARDAGLARELWFRLSENEATFAELAPRYSDGHEVHTGGIVGPSPFGAMHPALAAHLRSAQEGKLLKPLGIGDIFVVARVEKFLPAQFDESMEARMTEELAAQWLDAKINESAAG